MRAGEIFVRELTGEAPVFLLNLLYDDVYMLRPFAEGVDQRPSKLAHDCPLLIARNGGGDLEIDVRHRRLLPLVWEGRGCEGAIQSITLPSSGMDAAARRTDAVVMPGAASRTSRWVPPSRFSARIYLVNPGEQGREISRVV